MARRPLHGDRPGRRHARLFARASAKTLLLEVGLPLALYTVLAIALSWPTVQHFTTGLTSDGGDGRSFVWQFWHFKQVILGESLLFHAPLLYYPVGASLLTNGAGPVLWGLALPFWIWGPEASYNGALLAGFVLTGDCMYLLARDLGLSRGLALFAGTVLVAAPIRLAGTLGHLDRAFLGLLPLALLCLHRTLDPNRSNRWAVATAAILLLTLLLSGDSFIYAVVAVGFFLGDRHAVGWKGPAPIRGSARAPRR